MRERNSDSGSDTEKKPDIHVEEIDGSPVIVSDAGLDDRVNDAGGNSLEEDLHDMIERLIPEIGELESRAAE